MVEEDESSAVLLEAAAVEEAAAVAAGDMRRSASDVMERTTRSACVAGREEAERPSALFGQVSNQSAWPP